MISNCNNLILLLYIFKCLFTRCTSSHLWIDVDTFSFFYSAIFKRSLFSRFNTTHCTFGFFEALVHLHMVIIHAINCTILTVTGFTRQKTIRWIDHCRAAAFCCYKNGKRERKNMILITKSPSPLRSFALYLGFLVGLTKTIWSDNIVCPAY